MKLYLLTRPDTCGYDETAAFVVCAASPKAARVLAGAGSDGLNRTSQTEGKLWVSQTEGKLWARADCEYLGTAGPRRRAGIVLEDFRAS